MKTEEARQATRVQVAESGEHLGLLGMRERVEMVGGTFRVESTPGKQTTVRVKIPHRHAGRRKRLPIKSGNTEKECP